MATTVDKPAPSNATQANESETSKEISTKEAVIQQQKENGESLSTKLTNIPAVGSSIDTVSKTCKEIRESNAYVEYGVTVAGSSIDKAIKAGKSVLESSTLAPITNKAIDNFQYLDKEAGAMVEKIFGDSNYVANGNAVKSDNTAIAVVQNESIVSFLGRKIFEMTSLLVFLPKYAVSAVLNMLRGSPAATRKRKEHSISEDIQNLEPSPVKRKFGDRNTSSSEEEDQIIELLQVKEDYVSEEDSDYEQPEHEGDESDEEVTESEKEEIKKELEDLKEDSKQHKEIIDFDEDTSKDGKKTRRNSSGRSTALKSDANKPGKAGDISKSEGKENKAGSEKESTKTQKSPLLERLLSPKRRSEKNKTKASKSPEKKTDKESEKSEKLSEKAEKSKKASDDASKNDKPKATGAPAGEASMTTVTGPFDLFKSGKKSK